MKILRKYSVIILSLAFLMSVGACNRHSGRDTGKDSGMNDTTTIDTTKSETKSSMVIALTPSQKDSIKKSKKDSVMKAKQDSANQVIVNEIAKRIKAMPDSVLDNKLAEIVSRSDNNESKISELKTYIFIIGGVSLLLIILYIWLFIKIKIKTDDISDKLSGFEIAHNRSLKKSISNDEELIWINKSANISTTKSQIENIIDHILKEKRILPLQGSHIEIGSDTSSHNKHDDLYNNSRGRKKDETSSYGKSNVDDDNKTDSEIDVKNRDIIYLGLPFNNQYFKAEEKGESNCFVAELSKNGNSGHFTLISLDRIKSDTISSSILNITGKVKLSDATHFETLAEGKIVKADNFWKVEIPLTIAIS